MMHMIDVAVPNFDGDDDTPTRPQLVPAARHTSFAQSRSRADDDDEEYHVDVESDDEPEADEADDDDGDKDDEGEKEEFFDTQDIAEGVSPLARLTLVH